MSIIVKVSPMLQIYTDNTGTVEVSGVNVRECLDDLSAKYPKLEQSIFDKYGVLKLVILLNGKPVTANSMGTDVYDSDIIDLFMPVDGG